MTSFSIYQVKKGPAYRDYRFASKRELNDMGLEIRRENYDLVYSGFTSKMAISDDRLLEELFYQFNMERPENFYGHSLSVSDVISLNGRAYFCNSCTWVPVEGENF